MPPRPGEGDLFGQALVKAEKNRVVEVWPENWPPVELFLKVSTQWRIGMGGREGLDYNVLFRLMDRNGLQGTAWDEMFEDIRTLELAALNANNET